MAASIQEAKLTGFPACVPRSEARVQAYKEAFEENHDRVYLLAFRMTGNEVAAEEVMVSTFCRAFATSAAPDAEGIDRALITELRELTPIGVLTLASAACTQVVSLRRNVRRLELEAAVSQLPPTERLVFLFHDVEGYDHGRIARTLGIDEEESAQGLHQARLRIREILAAAA